MALDRAGFLPGLLGPLTLEINGTEQDTLRQTVNIVPETEVEVSLSDDGTKSNLGLGLADTLTGKTLASPTLSGSPVISAESITTSNDAKGTATDRQPESIQTTDATATNLDTFAFTTSDAGLVVSALVVGVKSDGSQVAGYSLAALFKNDSGTVTQVGTTTQTVLGESDAAWDATIDNSTTTIRVRVTGKAATTIRWSCVYTRLQVIP